MVDELLKDQLISTKKELGELKTTLTKTKEELKENKAELEKSKTTLAKTKEELKMTRADRPSTWYFIVIIAILFSILAITYYELRGTREKLEQKTEQIMDSKINQVKTQAELEATKATLKITENILRTTRLNLQKTAEELNQAKEDAKGKETQIIQHQIENQALNDKFKTTEAELDKAKKESK